MLAIDLTLKTFIFEDCSSSTDNIISIFIYYIKKINITLAYKNININ